VCYCTLQRTTVSSGASSGTLRRSHSATVSLTSSDDAAAKHSSTSASMSTPLLYGSASVLLPEEDSHSLTIAASKR
jgi:hypothetical protein